MQSVRSLLSLASSADRPLQWVLYSAGELMRVFKYRGGNSEIFERDLCSLDSDTFWAPSRETLNDPCEGFVSSEAIYSQIESMVALISPFTDGLEDRKNRAVESICGLLEHRDKVGIFSLSKTHNDELLWAHYANSHYGFCIEYDLEKLIGGSENEWFHFPVTYGDAPPKLKIDDVISNELKNSFIEKMISYKSGRWRYEKETRIVCQQPGAQPYDFRSVKAIYFGLRMETDQKEKIFEKLQGREIEYYQMELKENAYTLTERAVEDPYTDAPKYQGRMAPVQSYAIDPGHLKKEWKSYAYLMPRVAELARRCPFAKSVEMVEVAADRSTSGQPVFFATIKKGEFRNVNLYYSISEIESKCIELGIELP